MVSRLASVKLNQIVRDSGQPATSSNTMMVGARNSQALRVRSWVSADFGLDMGEAFGIDGKVTLARAPARPDAASVGRAFAACAGQAGYSLTRLDRGGSS